LLIWIWIHRGVKFRSKLREQLEKWRCCCFCADRSGRTFCALVKTAEKWRLGKRSVCERQWYKQKLDRKLKNRHLFILVIQTRSLKTMALTPRDYWTSSVRHVLWCFPFANMKLRHFDTVAHYAMFTLAFEESLP